MLFFAVAACSLLPPAFAQKENRSLLRIRLSDHSPLVADIDSRSFTKVSTSLTFGDLPPGKHKLKVYRAVQDYNGKFRHGEVLYNSRIRIDPQTFNSYTVDVYRGTITTDVRPLSDGDIPPRHRQQDREYNSTDAQIPDNYNNGHNNTDQPGNYPRQDAPPPPPVAANGNPVPPAPPVPPATTLPGGLSSGEMTDLQAQVSQKITDTEKEKMLEMDLTGRAITTDQLRAMLLWFGFESTRLDFAKWAYSVTADKENFPAIGDEFRFSASQKEFDDFLQSRH